METKKSKKKLTLPRAIDLSIRLLVENPLPDEDGRWTFYATFPRQGVPDFRIKSKTAKEAQRVLEDYLYNELDGRDTLVADD